MPDSFPPLSWGPAAFDERDLDALLSGEPVDVPAALLQVADALAALRAAPTLAELSSESTIMAEFSALAEFRALGLSQASRDDGQSHTLVLPVPPAHVARSRGARHRSRRTKYPVSRRTGGFMAAAAAVLVFAAVAVTGNLPGPLHNLARMTTATPTATHTTHGSTSPPGPLGTGTTTPTRSHTATASQGHTPASAQVSEQSKLCHEFFAYFKDPGPEWRTRWKSEKAVLKQLAQQAGGESRVPGYCAGDVRDLFPPNTLPQPGSHLWPLDPGQDHGNPNQGNQGGQPSPAATPTPPANGTAKGSIKPNTNGQPN